MEQTNEFVHRYLELILLFSIPFHSYIFQQAGAALDPFRKNEKPRSEWEWASGGRKTGILLGNHCIYFTTLRLDLTRKTLKVSERTDRLDLFVCERALHFAWKSEKKVWNWSCGKWLNILFGPLLLHYISFVTSFSADMAVLLALALLRLVSFLHWSLHISAHILLTTLRGRLSTAQRLSSTSYRFGFMDILRTKDLFSCRQASCPLNAVVIFENWTNF